MLILPINQNLIVKKGTKLEDIKEVISHPHAIPQCKNFLNEYLPDVPRTTASSTAEAIRMVSLSEQSIAGIGNKRAAELYGLEVLEECIQDNKNNFTQSPFASFSLPDAFFPFSVIFFFRSILYKKLFGALFKYLQSSLSNRCPASCSVILISCMFCNSSLHGEV